MCDEMWYVTWFDIIRFIVLYLYQYKGVFLFVLEGSKKKSCYSQSETTFFPNITTQKNSVKATTISF